MLGATLGRVARNALRTNKMDSRLMGEREIYRQEVMRDPADEQYHEQPKFGQWQDISTAPRDGTPFLVKWEDCVYRAFYKENKNYNARQKETLQIMIYPGHYSAAGSWCVPTHWMPDPPEE